MLTDLQQITDQTEMTLEDREFKVHLNNVTVKKRETFIDYIMGGCEIGLHVAIDFTSSNGKFDQPSSLHFLSDKDLNQYQQAIWQVGQILQSYDTDMKYPVYGFGGVIPYSGNISHCFALNGNIFDPEVSGVSGILETYKHAVKKVTMSSPTKFSPVVSHINHFCKHSASQNSQ